MGKLPNPEKVLIDLNKLIGYCLNPEHPEGQPRSRVGWVAAFWQPNINLNRTHTKPFYNH